MKEATDQLRTIGRAFADAADAVEALLPLLEAIEAANRLKRQRRVLECKAWTLGLTYCETKRLMQ